MSPGNDFFSMADDGEIPLCDVSDFSATLARAKPLLAPLPKGSKEHRTVQRYLVRWHCTASIDSNGAHPGRIKDVSISGAAILHEKNFHAAEFVKLHIYVSPPPPARIPCVVSVIGKIVYTLYDSKEQCFRTGVSFLKFGTEHDPVFLEEHLKIHSITVIS